MDITGIVIGVCLLFLIIIVIINYNIVSNMIKKLDASNEDYLKEKEQKLIDQIYSRKKTEIEEKAKNDAAPILESLQAQIDDKTKYNSQLQKIREEELDRLIKEEEKVKREEVVAKVKLFEIEQVDKTNKALQELLNTNNARRLESEEELRKILEELDDYRAKQAAINEEILRRREIEENETFYKIELDSNAIADVEVLSSIRPRLVSPQNLDKLIYDLYISKPATAMIKRVLQGEKPCGIYKITRLKTGEIYIGKSTDISSRWQQHVKSAYHCGTISHSILHTTMEKDGIQNFTFEVVEVVDKDKLTEREKFWIGFYDSKNYGLNERNG